jgi:hypothetical protein
MRTKLCKFCYFQKKKKLCKFCNYFFLTVCKFCNLEIKESNIHNLKEQSKTKKDLKDQLYNIRNLINGL